MIRVAKHINRLLYLHDCVIVPELGGFVANAKSAQLDVDKNIFLPPSKEIGFNRSLTHNDGLLITYFAQQENVSYPEAKDIIDQFAKQALKQIANNEVVSIENVGELKQDALGNIQFNASKSDNFLSDSFGLTSFHFSPVVPVRRPAAPNKNVRRLLRPITQKQIAASIAVIFGLFIISSEVNDSRNNAHFDMANTMSFMAPRTKATTDALPVEIPPVAEVEEVAEANNIYFLIAGSFKKQSQAERFLQEVKNLGESEAFVLKSNINNSYRVAIQGYSDRKEAITGLNAYRKKTDFSSVWILTQR